MISLKVQTLIKTLVSLDRVGQAQSKKIIQTKSKAVLEFLELMDQLMSKTTV